MKREHLLITLFLTIAAVSLYLFYRIIIPFFAPICWAAVFAILFFPLYEKTLARVKTKGFASLIVCIVIVVLIIGPITYLFIALVNEAADAVVKVNEMYKSGQLDELFQVNLPWLDSMKEKLSQYYDLSKVDLDEIAKDAINKVSSVVVSQTTWLIANGTKAVFYFVLMIFAMYYFFKEGTSMVNTLKRLTPLPAQQVSVTFSHLRDVIQATMYGGVVVALIQGILGGILFLAVGIGSPIFWGAIMAFLAILPFVGAFIVYVPAALLLIIGGSYVKGIVVILIGSLIISQVDNVIRPYLISGKTAMHPLLLFFCIMGGIALFGLLGIVLGPMIGAIFMTLLKIIELALHPDTSPAAPES